MDSNVVIRADGLGKRYLIGHEIQRQREITLRDALTRQGKNLGRNLRDLFGGRHPVSGDTIEDFWALKDVSFEIERGDAVGLIGRNGAGKSTLLKILSRITDPSEGSVQIRGRVASLLEVGTGFHPELSGRENIFLNGAILGMSRAEMLNRFDEIVAFAGVEKFLDTPVKRYSSGMYVRLAFSVAAHVPSEVLIIDEVLAVGDAEFQKKCLGKMEMISGSGRTILFVSHNLRTVFDLCSSAILLDGGTIRASGLPREVVAKYVGAGAGDVSSWRPDPKPGAAFRYNAVAVSSGDPDSVGSFPYCDDILITFDYTVAEDLPAGRLSFKIVNQDGFCVLGSADTDATSSLNRPWRQGRTIARCVIPKCLLTPGHYTATFSEPDESGDTVLHQDLLSFTVNGLGNPGERDGRRALINPILAWELLSSTET